MAVLGAGVGATSRPGASFGGSAGGVIAAAAAAGALASDAGDDSMEFIPNARAPASAVPSNTSVSLRCRDALGDTAVTLGL